MLLARLTPLNLFDDWPFNLAGTRTVKGVNSIQHAHIGLLFQVQISLPARRGPQASIVASHTQRLALANRHTASFSRSGFLLVVLLWFVSSSLFCRSSSHLIGPAGVQSKY